jgi:hypothetical protein
MEFKETKAKFASKQIGKYASLALLLGLSLSLTACGGGGGGGGSGGGTVTNNGNISNPQAYTMPSGGVATVPPTGN